MRKQWINKVLAAASLLTIGALTACGSEAPAETVQAAAGNAGAEAASEQAEVSQDALGSEPTQAEQDTLEAATELPEKIVVGIMPDYPPYDYQDADGNAAGYDVEVTKEVAARLGIEVEFQIYPWESLLPALESGRIDAVTAQIYRSPEREEKFYFSAAPYYRSDVNMIVKGDSTAENLEDVLEQGLVFSVIPGQLNEQYLNEAGIKSSYFEGSSQTQIDDVLAGHSDGFLNQWALVNQILIDKGAEGALKSIGEPLASDFVYAVLPKTDAGWALGEAFSKVYLELEADGTLTKLAQEYLGDPVVEGLEAGVVK